MRIEKIEFEQLFPTGVYANQRLRAVATVNESDNIPDCYKHLKQEVENAFVVMNPQIKWEEIKPEPIIQTDSKESATERMISAINACTEIKVLETFKLLVKNNPVFQEAYDKKLQSLQK